MIPFLPLFFFFLARTFTQKTVSVVILRVGHLEKLLQAVTKSWLGMSLAARKYKSYFTVVRFSHQLRLKTRF